MLKSLIIVVFVIFVVVFVAETLLKSKLRRTMADCLINKDYSLFDSVRNNKLTMLLFPKNDLYYYDLNKAVALNDDGLIERTVKRLEGLKLTVNQKETIYSTVFYHYLSAENSEKIKPYYEKLSKLRGDSLSEEDVLYDVYALKGFKYLDEVLEIYENATGEKKSSIELMLSKIYENKGDKTKSKEYFDKAKNRLNN